MPELNKVEVIEEHSEYSKVSLFVNNQLIIESSNEEDNDDEPIDASNEIDTIRLLAKNLSIALKTELIFKIKNKNI